MFFPSEIQQAVSERLFCQFTEVVSPSLIKGVVRVNHCPPHHDSGMVRVKHCLSFLDKGVVRVKHCLHYLDRGMVRVKHCLSFLDKGMVRFKPFSGSEMKG